MTNMKLISLASHDGAPWLAKRDQRPDRRAWLRSSIIDEGVPPPVLRFPVVSHDEVLRILADKPNKLIS